MNALLDTFWATVFILNTFIITDVSIKAENINEVQLKGYELGRPFNTYD